MVALPVRPTPTRNHVARACVVALVLGLLTLVSTMPAEAAGDPCGPSGNAISCENSKPGSPPSEWDVDGSGSNTIQGFSTDISTNVGGTIDFKIDTSAKAYTVAIYRLGYYGGLGARKIADVKPSASLPQSQPQCVNDTATLLYDCGNWGVSASWSVPSTAVSGVYIALLERTDTGASSHITFIVRDDTSRSDVVFQTSDPTWQAYNTYGGSNFYQGSQYGRAFKVSYNRPVLTRDGIGGRDFFFANEYPAMRFLEKNGYDTSYIAGVDTDRSGALLKNHKVFLSLGHDEYWSGTQRKNVEAARDAGVNLQFLSGNEVYWRTRYEPSIDTGKTPYRTLVSYKETWSDSKIDPSSEWTGTWRDPRFASTAQGGGLPENALTGTMYRSNYTDLAMQVPAALGKNRLWRNTSVATLAPGATATLAPHTIGYESDEDVDNGRRPAGLIRLSSTTGAAPEMLTDYGKVTKPGTTTHSTTLYRAPSGALVFGAGTVQWTWGLDATHDTPFAPEPADQRMQQAQVNLLADMSAQPTTLAAGLVPATASSDTTGPVVSITSPDAGTRTSNGTKVTLTGTATDATGMVAGIEVSTDDGATWHPATGTTAWTYSYVQHGTGPTPVRVRATDDSANTGAVATRSFDVSCPCSVYGSDVPTNPSASDTSPVELGLRFSPTTDGAVTGVRFYKASTNTGTHVGSLWSASGTRLATVTFGAESATGWQQATFSTPVTVSAGATYVVSYTAPKGGYSADTYALAEFGIDATPLRVEGGYGKTPGGVYGTAGTFPNRSFQSTTYAVDVLFKTAAQAPLVVSGASPVPGATSVPTGSRVSATFTKQLAPGTAAVAVKDPGGTTVPGSTTYDEASRTVTFVPSQALAPGARHSVVVSGTDTYGNSVSDGGSWTFTTAKPAAAAGVCPCTLFDDATQPAVLDTGETVPVTVGTRFSTTRDGLVTGLQFYKAAANTGTHVGTLWSSSGQVLASGTFTGESAAGWQRLSFADPVQINKNTDYVVSYRSTSGSYPVTASGFSTSDLSRGPLVVGPSAGVYNYSNSFPSRATSTNYFVDPVFDRLPASMSVTGQDPAPGAADVPRDTSVRIWFNDALAAGWSMSVTAGSTPIDGSVQPNLDGTGLVFRPSATLPAGTSLRATVSGITSVQGVSLADQTWTFTTSTNDPAVAETLFSNQVPTNEAVNDSSPIQVGTAFTPAKNGTVTGIRFYKGSGNGGTHVGSLWSSDGTRLASVSFPSETPSGWQTARLGTPVAVKAGTTYVVSYFAPQGHYASTPKFFNSPLVNGNLTAPSGGNGRYAYGTASSFPTQSFQASSYFVDVQFVADRTPLEVVSRTPLAGATSVPLSTNPSLSFNVPLATGATMTLKQGATPVAGSTALSEDKKTLAFKPDSALAPGAGFSVTASGLVSSEGASLDPVTWTFSTEALAAPTATLFGDLLPATASSGDTAAIEIGTAFTPSVSGAATGARFYKGPGNGGTHTASLWTASGTRLATATYVGESASGWQRVNFPSAVQLAAGQTYVVSYYAPQGNYSVTPQFFAGPWTAGPLTAPSTTNGRYRYGAGGGFPTGSYRATNYFADIVFRPDN
ncbi:hypothetical protein ASG49_08175 [Marmoricola sp. Leaf446]|uniref:DUF4082 domain-containing protein n=1 Tax=Marmoricola sp. Leaf446 TaxID=1736379 RepID=UPI0006F3492C|nr:DUF4082 domain-containing protein [Marmoricola sp. Leaf446]KQT91960.1 hypothetical protein ASG49_08175 [Marmoricola sp. Leaf446]